VPRLLYALSIFVVLGVSAQAIPRESVRTELAQLEKQKGLTLTSYYDGLQVVSFKNHRKYHGKKLVPMEGGASAISRDGTEIALELVRWEKERRESLAIVRWDGNDPREYPGIVALDACWSHDQSKLAMTVFIKPNANLGILDLGSKQMHTFEPRGQIDQRSHFTSQCWSQDDRRVVYETEGNVQVYEIGDQNWRILAKGTQPTWSPDGNWIAYRDGDSYYAIRPAGEDKKKLFHKTRAVSGLYWSPDSRFVAYVHQDFLALDTEFFHLMVRRLDDNSEDWVADGVDCCINYEWVVNPELLKLAQSWATK